MRTMFLITALMLAIPAGAAAPADQADQVEQADGRPRRQAGTGGPPSRAIPARRAPNDALGWLKAA